MTTARVAYQGAPGAFSDEAARAFFRGQPIDAIPCMTFEDIATALLDRSAEYGIFPVQNAIAGPVHVARTVLDASTFLRIGRMLHPIRLHLAGTADATLAGVRTVLSHPMALAQCGAFFGRATHATPVEFYDTAGATEEVARRGDPSVAAIGPRGAAERHGLQILARNVQDRIDNFTEFVVVRAR